MPELAEPFRCKVLAQSMSLTTASMAPRQAPPMVVPVDLLLAESAELAAMLQQLQPVQLPESSLFLLRATTSHALEQSAPTAELVA